MVTGVATWLLCLYHTPGTTSRARPSVGDHMRPGEFARGAVECPLSGRMGYDASSFRAIWRDSA
eukprot:2979958-Alexandrium_andersonii.AAC.1